MKEYKIDSELNEVLPDLSDEDYKALEESLLTEGFKGAPIIIWQGKDIIIDGHNRYQICKKHNIPFEAKEIEFSNKDEVTLWMVKQQMGRRNLTPLQRIELAEKYRPMYRKKAKENQSKAGTEYGNGGIKLTANLPQTSDTSKKRNSTVDKQLSDIAGTSERTYRMGAKILNSGDETLIGEIKSGEKTINRAYNELKEKSKSAVETKKQENTPAASVNVTETEVVSSAEVEQMNIVEVTDTPENDNTHACEIEPIESSVEESADYTEERTTLDEICNRCYAFLTEFQNDTQWLLAKYFWKNEDDVTERIHSDIRNCLERIRNMNNTIEKMQIDDIDGNITINM